MRIKKKTKSTSFDLDTTILDSDNIAASYFAAVE